MPDTVTDKQVEQARERVDKARAAVEEEKAAIVADEAARLNEYQRTSLEVEEQRLKDELASLKAQRKAADKITEAELAKVAMAGETPVPPDLPAEVALAEENKEK